ncbi:hypothetical protein O988_05263 [Pseudogymnoascus sp. VKM F-3808]|nr:hypothetical protein O988_05263 [Pseudogymnoascus sp. VKM F-3808]
MADQTIIIGIDFGTTFSGVAWTTEGCPDDLEVISSWPGSQNRTSEKVPSVMAYETRKEKSAFRWGFQVSPFTESIRGLKLLLDESQQSRYGPSVRSKEILTMLEKDPVSVASDYLRELLAVVKGTQTRRLGETYVRSAKFRIVLTVPAVWSDKAKDATLRAAEDGLGDHQLIMISEPEAAALHTLRAIQPNTITNGDTFVVCDAGGGTVDLITYQVRSVEPLDLYEVVQGDGGICGAAMLDKRFETFIKDRLGAQWSQLSEKSKNMTLSCWENNIKCNFSGTGDNEDDLTEFLIVIPGASDNVEKGIEGGMMLVESEDIAAIFDPIIQDIESLVQRQIKSAELAGYNVKAILLVGGFGSSTYLYRRLRKKFRDIDIMQPPNAWTSVVSLGLDGGKMESRKQDVLGMELLDGKKISLEFYRVVDVHFGSFVFRDKLLCCNDESSPEDGEHPSIFPLCTVEADLTKVPKDLFVLATNSKGKQYYKIPYELEMTFKSASIFFELVFEGISYGSVRAKY